MRVNSSLWLTDLFCLFHSVSLILTEMGVETANVMNVPNDHFKYVNEQYRVLHVRLGLLQNLSYTLK